MNLVIIVFVNILAVGYATKYLCQRGISKLSMLL